MGTHASAEIFYGVAWPAEELPEKWAKEQQARWDAGNYDGGEDDDDPTGRMESLLKELGLDSVLEVGFHGNLAYDSSGEAVRVIGTRSRIGCGDIKDVTGVMRQVVSADAAAAIVALVDHLGADKATVGWLVTVTYGRPAAGRR